MSALSLGLCKELMPNIPTESAMSSRELAQRPRVADLNKEAVRLKQADMKLSMKQNRDQLVREQSLKIMIALQKYKEFGKGWN